MPGDLLEKLEQYSSSDFYPLHMPGHKRRISYFRDPFEIDITEIEGFDDLHHAQDILLEAQRRAARLYGAEETYYLINGSTCGILAAAAASTTRGGRILMARNSHRSCYHAVFLNGLRVTYLYPPVSTAGSAAKSCLSPRTDAVNGLCGSIRPEDVKEALREHPDIQAVLITSPTYDGVVSDIGAIAEAAHGAGAVLIVDEAHGAHFGMHPYFPERALLCGADIVINSLHKTLPSLTQTALLHVQGERADRERLRKYLDIYQTSSPSYVLMAGMDACIRLMEKHGDELFDTFVARLEQMRSGLRKRLQVLQLIDKEVLLGQNEAREARAESGNEGMTGHEPVYDFDRSRVLISTRHCAMTGPELAGILRGRYRLEPEMAAAGYVTAIMTVADTQEGFDRLEAALLEIDAGLASGNNLSQAQSVTESADNVCAVPEWKRDSCNEEILTIQEAQERPSEQIPLGKSAGRISAGYIYLYPPGIPLLVPGEQISEKLLLRLRAEQSAGLKLKGMADDAGETILAVKEKNCGGYAGQCRPALI